MKLQYLGDARDAFKWDLLHWICTQSSPPFAELVFVPLLTPDIEGSKEGRIPHHWFDCQDFIRPFVASLQDEPRSFSRISALGKVDRSGKFQVSVFAPERLVSTGLRRSEYWSGFKPKELGNSVVFLDPDNGFETKTKRGPKWVRHSELRDMVVQLPESSVIVVYQHRPQFRYWDDVLTELGEKLSYVHTAAAAYEGNLAFIAMAHNVSAGNRVISTVRSYAEVHPIVRFRLLRKG